MRNEVKVRNEKTIPISANISGDGDQFNHLMQFPNLCSSPVHYIILSYVSRLEIGVRR